MNVMCVDLWFGDIHNILTYSQMGDNTLCAAL